MDRLIKLTMDFFDGLLGLPAHRVEDSEEALDEFALSVLPDFIPLTAYLEKEWSIWEDMQEKVIYLLEGPFHLRLLCIRLRNESVFLTAGPFSDEFADEQYCNKILKESGLSASVFVPLKLYFELVPVVDVSCAVTAAQAFIRQYYGLEMDVPVKLSSRLLAEKQMILLPQKEEARLKSIERRFELEFLFSQHVKAGDAAAAIEIYKKMTEDAQSLQRMGDALRGRKNRLLVLNTILTIAVRETNVHTFYIDATFGDYAYQIEHETELTALNVLGLKMIETYCDIVRRFARRGLSAAVRKTVDFISIHLSDKFSLDDLAAAANVSRNHLSALFAKEMGQTITAYINAERVKEMSRLLLTTSIPVGEIGSYVGFEDTNYASRVFKKDKGLSPTAFRETGGKGA